MYELHCHTRTSDGTYSLDELFKEAKNVNLQGIAITNHDTTRDLEEAIQLGKHAGIKVIPGIEISANDQKRNHRVHILGYFIKPNHPSLKAICDPITKSRQQAALKMIENVNAHGYELTLEEVEKYSRFSTNIYKQHIIHALMDKGYTSTIFGELYEKLFSRKENKAEQKGIANVPIEYGDVKDALLAIKEAGGAAVLAHPGEYDNFSLIPELVELGLDGVEVDHPKHDQKARDLAKAYAKEYRLIETAGSDFHGKYRDIHLGEKRVPLQVVEQLKSNSR